ncbi:MAG: cyclase family protein [Leptolinea sp.]|jgi:arylformamidase|nr:cyclase family protein [Leptolinea sp.]
MKYWDITLPISPELPVWPGDPQIKIERVSRIEDGANANVSRLDMGCHTGTHVDAPFHFLSAGKTIESLSLDALIGPVQVVRIPDDFSIITSEIIQVCGINSSTKRVLFKTYNSSFWQKFGSQFRTEFVGIDESGARELVNKQITLVGIDYLSIAPFRISRPTHEVFLKSSVVVLEGLDLSSVEPGDYTLICLPMKIAGVDGAPARVVLMQE